MTTQQGDDQERELRQRLRGLRADPPDEGFGAALRRRLLEAEPPPAPSLLSRLADAWRRPPRLLWPAATLAGAAAVALLAVGLGQRPAGPGAPGDARPVAVAVSVPSTKVALVRLDLAVDVAVAAADIQVSLPEGLVFWSQGEALADRSFAWTQALQAGRNEIPIAVRGLRPGRYHVTVTARAGDQLIAHDVPLEVTEG